LKPGRLAGEKGAWPEDSSASICGRIDCDLSRCPLVVVLTKTNKGDNWMCPRTLICTALTVLALTSTSALAQTLMKYGSEAGWEIFVRSDMGPGCLMTKKMADGMEVQMGIDATAVKRGYMALYTKADANVSAGDKIAVLFDVDGEQFSGSATGQQSQGLRGAFVPVNSPEFIYGLAEKQALTITPQGRNPIVVSLAGTHAAFRALRACQDAQ
jgi:hypothetical protein